jgi:hypothetical protein
VRVTVARLGLAGRDVDVEHAHERVLERQLVRVRRDLERIERILRLRPHGSRGDERERGDAEGDRQPLLHACSLSPRGG